jgi:diguanylate cyclase
MDKLFLLLCIAIRKGGCMMSSPIDDFIRKHNDVFRILTRNLPDLLFLMQVDETGHFRYVLMNAAAMKVTGLTEAVYGKSLEESMPAYRVGSLKSYYLEAVRSRESVSYVENFDGLYGETILTPIFSDENEQVCTHVLAITRDITPHETYQRQLTHLANHDPLTGLSNRRGLYESLLTFEQGAIEGKRILAVMYMDCDKFKRINDTYGHDVGDEFLTVIGKRLRHCLKDADLICRLGGDEFVAITSITEADQIKLIGKRVVRIINQPILIHNEAITESMSVGIALYPNDGPDLDIVIKKADRMLQTAKRMGGNSYAIFG